MNRTIRILIAAVALAAVPSVVLSAEKSATKPVMTLEAAKRVAMNATAEAKRLNAPGGAIAVVDDGGHLLYLERLDNTFPAASSVAIEKARTAATFRRPTNVFEDAIKNGRQALLGVQVMTPLQGGVPVTIDGQVVGAIGVSGAASAQQDDDIAKAAVVVFTQTAMSR